MIQHSIDSLHLHYLEQCEARFDHSIGLLGTILEGQGYHTALRNGSYVHPCRENFGYALALLTSKSPHAVEKASAILRKLLPLQDGQPGSATYGIWPWFFEEPIEKMRPPDWNWADFCGAKLGHILIHHGNRLPSALKAQIEQALLAAAYSIFRRNVPPSYTNIAVLGGIVASLAGEELQVSLLLRYGRERLKAFLEYTSSIGGFSEYNSPVYGLVILTEAERGLLLAKDEEVRARLSEIHSLCWRMVGKTLHLPTGQICGPQSRAYSDFLPADIVLSFEQSLGFRLKTPLVEPDWTPAEHLFLIPRVPCPEDVKAALLERNSESFKTCEFVRSPDPSQERIASIWMTDSACLGSINFENLWTQRRAVLGFWNTRHGCASLRVRMLNNGVDFASGIIRTVQQRSSLLGLITLATNKGSLHDHLDTPEDGAFEVKNLCISIEVECSDGVASRSEDGFFIVATDTWSVRVIPVFGAFSERSIKWTIEGESGRHSVRAVIDKGNRFRLTPKKIAEAGIGFFLQLLHEGDNAELPVASTVRMPDGSLIVSVNSVDCSLALNGPLKPEAFV